jgi:hypothetical protein
VIAGLGIGLLWVGGFGAWMMHITQSIPNRFPWQPMMRHEDPEGFWLHMTICKAMACVGAALLAIHFATGL